MGLMKWLFRIGVLVALLGILVWHLDEDIPEGFQEERKLRLMFAGLKTASFVANSLHWLGIYPYYKSLRAGAERGAKTVPIPEGMLISDNSFINVPVRVYRPSAHVPEGHPAVVFFHGGAFAIGSVNMYDHLMIRLGTKLPLVIVSVEYRLAPESFFPAAIQDCEAATKYFLKHAREFGVDPGRVAIMGDSAGGNFAAAITQKIRDDGFSPKPKRQILIYPSLQSIDFQLPSYQQYANGPFLKLDVTTYFRSLYAFGHSDFQHAFAENRHTSPKAKKHIYQNYLRHEDLEMDYHYHPYQKPDLDFGNSTIWEQIKSVLMNPYFAPLLAKDFGNLPDACIVTVHYDMLRDDGILYSQKLSRAGVKVNHIHMTHAHHGVFSLAGTLQVGTDLFDMIVEDIKSTL